MAGMSVLEHPGQRSPPEPLLMPFSSRCASWCWLGLQWCGSSCTVGAKSQHRGCLSADVCMCERLLFAYGADSGSLVTWEITVKLLENERKILCDVRQHGDKVKCGSLTYCRVKQKFTAVFFHSINRILHCWLDTRRRCSVWRPAFCQIRVFVCALASAGGEDDVRNKHVQTDTRVQSPSRRPGLYPLYEQHTHSHMHGHTVPCSWNVFPFITSTNQTRPNMKSFPLGKTHLVRNMFFFPFPQYKLAVFPSRSHKINYNITIYCAALRGLAVRQHLN